MYFLANSRCRIENSVEKAAVFLHPLYIIEKNPQISLIPGSGLKFENAFLMCTLKARTFAQVINPCEIFLS